jgi:hypothetical protein
LAITFSEFVAPFGTTFTTIFITTAVIIELSCNAIFVVLAFWIDNFWAYNELACLSWNV